MSTTALQELLDKEEVDDQCLNKQCSENDLAEIGTHYCGKWEMIGYHLKLTDNEITGIDHDCKTTDVKRVKVLMKWRSKYGHRATYKVLIETLLSHEQADTAQKIIQWLKHQSNQKTHIETSIHDLENEFSAIQRKYAFHQSSTMDIHTLRAQCSALNPEVLQQLIREMGEKECNQLMESYMSKLQSFQSQTKLQSFKGSGEQLGLAPPAYSRLDVEFQDEWMDKTLEDLEDFRKHIPWKPCIMTRIVITASPTVVFSIPRPEQPLKVDINADCFDTGQLRRVTIDSECIFPRKEMSTVEKLLLACKNEDISLIEKLLNSETVSESDLQCQDESGNSPLMLASLFGNEKAVRLLLSQRADTNFKNCNNQTALMLACENGYESIVEMLLNHGAKIEIESKTKYTALTYAASGGHKRVTEILISHGAQVNEKALELATDPSLRRILENHFMLCDLKQKSQMGFTGMMLGLTNLIKLQDGVGLKYAFERLFEGSPQQHISPLEDNPPQPESESGKFPSMNSAFQLLLPVAKEWKILAYC